jgi:hypothetical protein
MLLQMSLEADVAVALVEGAHSTSTHNSWNI